MTDAVGTTTYAYKPVGALGALQVASIDGPLSNDTMVYSYDELGRATSRLLNGVGTTTAYDALGRVSTLASAVGTFTYGYVGDTGRVQTLSYPNGQTSTYSYLPNLQDHRLQTIHHTAPGGATLSRFDYTYDIVGNIQTWRQERAGQAPFVYRFGYDAADQLTAAVKQSTDRESSRHDRRCERLSRQRAGVRRDDNVHGRREGCQRQSDHAGVRHRCRGRSDDLHVRREWEPDQRWHPDVRVGRGEPAGGSHQRHASPHRFSTTCSVDIGDLSTRAGRRCDVDGMCCVRSAAKPSRESRWPRCGRHGRARPAWPHGCALRVLVSDQKLWTYYPDYSADGRLVAFSISPEHYRGEDWALAIVDSQQPGRPIRLTAGAGNDRVPDWRPPVH